MSTRYNDDTETGTNGLVLITKLAAMPIYSINHFTYRPINLDLISRIGL